MLLTISTKYGAEQNSGNISLSKTIQSYKIIASLATTLVVGATLIVAALITVISLTCRKNTTVSEKPAPLKCAPTGSNFLTLPRSRVTIRYIDSTAEGSTNKTIGGIEANQVTFLLLHGFAGVLETWELITPHLIRSRKTNENDLNVRVVALDLVGSGYSDKPLAFDYSYRNQGKVISEFISLLGLSNVVLVSHSSGTVVGAATVLEQQQDKNKECAIVGAVFLACALFHHKSDFFSKAWLKPMFQWMTTKMLANRKQSFAKMHVSIHAERVLTDEFFEKFAAPTRLPNFKSALVDTIMAKEAPYEELADGILSPSSANKTSPFPMLFVWGKQDSYKPLPTQQKELIKQKLSVMYAGTQKQQPILEMIELDECHHYPQHEQPEALANKILTFVEKNIKRQ